MRLTLFFIDEGKFDESIVEPFQVVYIVFGDNKTPSRYILKDWNWNDIDINILNSYQRGLLHDCLDFFQDTKVSFHIPSKGFRSISLISRFIRLRVFLSSPCQ